MIAHEVRSNLVHWLRSQDDRDVAEVLGVVLVELLSRVPSQTTGELRIAALAALGSLSFPAPDSADALRRCDEALTLVRRAIGSQAETARAGKILPFDRPRA